jgi:hypothetical protein
MLCRHGGFTTEAAQAHPHQLGSSRGGGRVEISGSQHKAPSKKLFLGWKNVIFNEALAAFIESE